MLHYVPYVESDVSLEDHKKYLLIRQQIDRVGLKGKGIFFADALLDPKKYGVKSPVRQEIMQLVHRSLEKIGIAGSRDEQLLLRKMIHLMKEDEGGGIL